MISPPRAALVVSLAVRILAIVPAIFLGACSGSNENATPGRTSSSAGAGIQINGAGATFPNPIYSKWFAEHNRLHPNVRINYQSLGSGAGIRQLTSRTVFFGASDQPMDERAEGRPGKILHFPTVLGAVVPVYNLPGGDRGAEVHRPAARRHRARQGQEVERSGDREAEPGRRSCRPPTSRSCIAPRLGHDVHLRRLPGKDLAGVQEQGRRGRVAEVAGRRRRQRQRGRVGSGARRRRARSATSSSSTRCRTRSRYGAVQNSAGAFVTASVEA